jgi:hypothetical protein
MNRPLAKDPPSGIPEAQPLNWVAPVFPSPAELRALRNIRDGTNGVYGSFPEAKGRRKGPTRVLEALKAKGWTVKGYGGCWTLTEAGLKAARRDYEPRV